MERTRDEALLEYRQTHFTCTATRAQLPDACLEGETRMRPDTGQKRVRGTGPATQPMK